MHWKVCHNYNIKTSEKWYDHEPETVTENEDVTILWDMPIILLCRVLFLEIDLTGCASQIWQNGKCLKTPFARVVLLLDIPCIFS